MLVAQLMERDFITVSPKENAQKVGQQLEESGIGTAIVAKDGAFTGVLSKETFLSRIGLCAKKRFSDLTVSDFMESDINCIDEGADIKRAVETMIFQKKFIDAIPVTQDDKVVGVLTKKDMTSLFAKTFPRRFRVGDLMHYNPPTADELEPVQKIVERMLGMSVKRVLVMASNNLRGIITVHDLSLVLFEHAVKSNSLDKASSLHAEDIMTRNPMTASARDDAAYIAGKMADKGIGAVPVVNGGLEGLIDRNDLLKGFEIVL